MKVENKGIKEIADGMLNTKIAIPLIQRGFVWKPYQIENIWDSIFRGYPIGSFLLAEDGNKMELFDGQQRATAIALGFYNPWDKKLTQIGNAKSLPTIWVDLYPKESNSEMSILPENSEHLFRVLTESHPWGYVARHNYTIMGVQDRIRAWDQMKASWDQMKALSDTEASDIDTNNYTQLPADLRLPYSSRLPVPLCILLEAGEVCSSKVDFKNRIISFVKEKLKHINTFFVPYYLSKNLEKKDIPQYFDALDKLDIDIWGQWYKRCKKILNKEQYCVPYIILSKDIICQNNSDEISSNSDPTLFVRLNSSGTNLEGEELIYSIFKSFFPTGKKVEESDIAKIIFPSRIIVLIARLLLNEEIDKHSRFPDKISSRRFQSLLSLKNDYPSLGERMDVFINEKMEALFTRAIIILRNNDSIPDVVVKSFIRETPNGFLLLLNFLRRNENLDDKICKAICRKLYRNYFFGNIDKISAYIYPDISKSDFANSTVWGKCIESDFWIKDTKDSYFNLLQIPLIRPTRLLQFYQSRIKKASENSWNYKTQLDPEEEADAAIIRLFEKYATDDDNRDQNINAAWDTFLWRLKNLDSRGKGLLLLAQNNYIQDTFSGYNQLKDLQDTNTPWDWDHIYPYSWMWGMPNFVYYWGNSLGNYRAMSLVDNRSESNNCSPQERCPERPDDVFYNNYYINKPLPDQNESDLDWWMKLGEKYKYLQFRKDNLDELCKNLAYAAAYRTVSIYQHFYDLFGINDDISIDTEKDH